jgi:hypothetical protein
VEGEEEEAEVEGGRIYLHARACCMLALAAAAAAAAAAVAAAAAAAAPRAASFRQCNES